MHLETATVGCHYSCQILNLLLSTLACVRIRMEMYGFNEHTALCHHPCGYRAVDSAGKECQPLSVGSQRKSAEACYLAFVYISTVASHIYMKKHIRIVYIHFKNLAAHQHLGADDSADFRRLDRESLVSTLSLNLESLNASFLDKLHHVLYSLVSDGVEFRRCLHRLAY